MVRAAERGDARFVTLTDLSKSAGDVIDAVVKDGVPAVVLRRGEYAAIIQKIDPDRLKQLVIAKLPSLVAQRDESEKYLEKGETSTLDDLVEELGIDLKRPPD